MTGCHGPSVPSSPTSPSQRKHSASLTAILISIITYIFHTPWPLHASQLLHQMSGCVSKQIHGSDGRESDNVRLRAFLKVILPLSRDLLTSEPGVRERGSPLPPPLGIWHLHSLYTLRLLKKGLECGQKVAREKQGRTDGLPAASLFLGLPSSCPLLGAHGLHPFLTQQSFWWKCTQRACVRLTFLLSPCALKDWRGVCD